MEDILTHIKQSNSKPVKGIREHRLIPTDGNKNKNKTKNPECLILKKYYNNNNLFLDG